MMYQILPRLLEAALGIVLLHAPLYSNEELKEAENSIGLLSAPPRKGGKALETLPDTESKHNTPSIDDSAFNKDTFTINFNNISIIEYIRFVSKITNLNFVFNDADLQFNVTVVSEDPVTPRNIMAILVQVLRIHNLVVLEQDNNLLITSTRSVSQIATIVSSDQSEEHATNSPVVTRVFRIKNAKLSTVSGIIKPMLSDSALIETSAETKQLIVTDITPNVDKISTLLESIDIPDTSLEIDSYSAQNANPAELISLANQILAPFAEGNPLIFVPQEATKTIFIVSTPYLIERAQTIFEDLDIPSSEKTPSGIGQNVFLHKLQYKTGDEFLTALEQVSEQLKSKDAPPKFIETLEGAKYIKESNSILFVGDDSSLAKAKDIAATLDTLGADKKALPSPSSFLVYKIQHASQDQMEESLDLMADNLSKAPSPDQALIDTIHSMSILKETDSLVFTGDEASLKKLSGILPTFDVSGEALALSKSNFLVYKILHASEQQLENSLNLMAENLANAPIPDQSLVDAIRSMKYISDTNSLVFTGSTAALAKLSEILPTFDTLPGAGQTIPSQFFIYNPRNRNGEELKKSLAEIANNLKTSGLSDPAFLQTVDSVKWIPANNSLIFTGTPESIQRVQEMLSAMDASSESLQKGEVYLYKPKYVSSLMLQEALQELAQNLDANNPSDANLQDALESAKLIEESQSLLFRSDPSTIKRIKELVSDLDTSEGLTGGTAHTFFLYKLQYAPGNFIVDNLTHVADNLQSSKVPNQALIQTIKNVKWIKDNNSILLTGSSASIDQTKKIIEQFDIPGAMAPQPGANKSSFFIYKTIHQPAQVVQKSLQDFEKDLGASGLIDPDLMLTLNTMRYVDATQSLLFTGTPASLEKTKELLSKIDVVSPSEAQIQQLGEHTFLIYKIQYVPAGQLLDALRGLSSDLSHTGAIDESVADAINSMKYIKETNSILFTGSAGALQKVELMIKKFDISSLAQQPEIAPPGTFVVYTPKFQPGDELISILVEFEQNLVASGLANPRLFNTINNLKYIAKTCSILISGDQESIAKVEELLRRFDVPNKEAVATTSIESIENTSFLIYKLQYHQGSEILSALKQISADVLKGAAGPNQNLLNAVNSLQWIRITNSLLGTGEPETLSKLKDLIQNLDIPLRQVFIEVLVLETSLTNTQNFGLQWGGKMQYLNRFGAGTGNFPLTSANSSSATTTPTSIFQSGINAVNPASPNNGINPSSSTAGIPFTTGFDLGIIGDIIMHKGKSFISLGSLVNALQTDTDSQVIMNPKIITQDNRNSTIFVGNNIPFAGSLVQTQSTINQQTTNLEYRDVGFNLSITPTIGNNNIVTLEINNDISEVIAPLTNTNSNNNTTITGITTSHTSMNTRVHVPDKHFVVLSGMLQDVKSHYRSQIPCLGGIPVIGLAFSENDRLDTKQNVLIFVRPHIINTYEEYKEITTQQEDLFKEQAGYSILKEEIDDGLGWVKTPENE